MPIENLTKHDSPKVKILVVEGEVIATMGPYMGTVEGYDQSGIKIAFTNGQSDYFPFTDIDADMKTLAALPVELRGLMRKDAGVGESTAQGESKFKSGDRVEDVGIEKHGVGTVEDPLEVLGGSWIIAVEWDSGEKVDMREDELRKIASNRRQAEKFEKGDRVTVSPHGDGMVIKQYDDQSVSVGMDDGKNINVNPDRLVRISRRHAAEENPERPDRPSDAATSGGIADLIVGTHGGCLKFERPDKQAVCLHGLSRNVDGSGILHTAGSKGEDLDEPMTAEEMDAVNQATDSNDIASEGRMKMRIMADPRKNIVLLNTDGSPKSTFTTQEFVQALVTKGVRQVVANRLVDMALKSAGHFVEFVPSEERARTGALDKVAFSIYAVAPEGWEDVVQAIKERQAEKPEDFKGEGSPWAIAWAAKNKGYKRNSKEASKTAMLEEHDTVQKPGSEDLGEVVLVDPISNMATVRWHKDDSTTEENLSELQKAPFPAMEAAIVTKKYLAENYGSDEDGYIPDEEEGHDEQGQDMDSGRSGPSKEDE